MQQQSIIYQKAKALASTNPWTNVYGMGRSLLAMGTLLTLLFNATNYIFREGIGATTAPKCGGSFDLNLFCMFAENLEVARWIAVFILVLVIIGVYPRITGLLHWWVSYSFMNAAFIVDGGDQVTTVLTLLILPICLTDNRVNHWFSSKKDPESETSLGTKIRAMIASSTLWVVQLQVAIIYFQAGVAKFNVDEWSNGTALYYWFNHPTMGAPEWLQPMLQVMLENPYMITIATYSVLVFEVLLFTGFFMEKEKKQKLLIPGLLFHIGIIMVFGLFSFFFAMAGALVLLLRPVDVEFRIKKISNITNMNISHWYKRNFTKQPQVEHSSIN